MFSVYKSLSLTMSQSVPSHFSKCLLVDHFSRNNRCFHISYSLSTLCYDTNLITMLVCANLTFGVTMELSM